MAVMTYREALNAALSEEMERDPDVFLMGEAVSYTHLTLPTICSV